MRSKLMTLVLVLAAVTLAASVFAQDPICHYPLLDDGVDVTGNYGDMTLEDAPFQDGGIYINGDFWGMNVTTPALTGMDLNLFSVIVDFKIENYHNVNMPVVWVGKFWRNVGFEITPGGYASLCVGPNDCAPSDFLVTLGEWHTARISYNAEMGFASAYLDGDLIMLSERDAPNPASDKAAVPVNGSFGRAFEGIWRELYVYNTDDIEVVATEATTWGTVKSLYR